MQKQREEEAIVLLSSSDEEDEEQQEEENDEEVNVLLHTARTSLLPAGPLRGSMHCHGCFRQLTDAQLLLLCMH